MTGKRLGKRILSGAMAFIMAASTLVVTPIKTYADGNIPAQMDSASQVNYDTILGRAVDFGITATTFVQQGHMETTFATNEFVMECGSNSDVDFLNGGTAQFLIGSIGASKKITGDHANKVVFGGTTANTFNIEVGPSVVPESVSHENGAPVNAGDLGNIHFNSGVDSVVVNRSTSTAGNVSRILSNATEKSNEMSGRASSDYAINYHDFAPNANEWSVNMDLSDPAFENKVVYIQVDDTLAKALAQSSGVSIIKNSSTVVVFNIEDSISNSTFSGSSSDKVYNNEKSVTIAKIKVSVDGGRSWIYTETGKDKPDEYKQVDREICQKIIWNIRTTGIVNLNICAGTFVMPYAKDVFVKGSSAGWAVAPRMTVDSGEWHYIFQRGSQDTINDGYGEIHLAARKAFTADYTASGNPIPDKSVSTTAGTYKFQLYKCADANYSSPAAFGEVVSNQETSKIHFPKLTFTPSDNNKTYYYLIREIGAGSIVNEGGAKVEVSDGEIRVSVKVSYDEKTGSYSYNVSHKTILGNDVEYKVSEDVDMSGVEFNLGAFYNKVLSNDAPVGTDVVISKKTVAGDELEGAILKLEGKYADNTTVVMNSSSITVEYGAGAKEQTRIPYELAFMSGSEPTLIKNLPDAVYTLTEITAPKGYEIAEKIIFEIKDGKVLNNSGDAIEDGIIKMVDANADTYDVTISKVDANTNDELAGARFYLIETSAMDGTEITDFHDLTLMQGAMDVTVSADICDCYYSMEWNSGKEPTKIIGLKPGTYYLYEKAAPQGYEGRNPEDAVLITIDKKGNVLDENGKEFPARTVVVKNTPQVVVPDTGKLVITKTIEGDVTKEEAEGALKFTITTTAADGTTNYVKADGSLTTTKTQIGLGQFKNENGKYTLELDKLETGSYSVTEEITDIDGYKLASVSYKVDGTGSNGKTATATVKKDATTTVAYTDVYEKEVVVPDTGKLVITKTIEGDVTKEEAEGA
ncbi:MAG: hypothetical protein IKH46_17010, partial [Lachnospiraceae bacterium]|nr:hypothetical protein [Lachnospiraceae bacterium]